MTNEKKSIESSVAEHETRNASLKKIFLARNIDFREPRTIECHFWVWDKENTAQLAEALKSRGFRILIMRPAEIAEDPDRWNLEASVRQSIDLTMRREFIDDLVNLANSVGGVYDGWGTQI